MAYFMPYEPNSQAPPGSTLGKDTNAEYRNGGTSEWVGPRQVADVAKETVINGDGHTQKGGEDEMIGNCFLNL